MIRETRDEDFPNIMLETRSAPERYENGPVQKVCGMMRRLDDAAGLKARAGLGLIAAYLAAAVLLPSPASADSIKNPTAVFAALDKVTGRISHLEIPINQTVEFGALKVTPRVCDTTPPTETPHTASFVEVDETKLTGEIERIFTGWMFAESPGLHAVEHPVFDVWLTSCKTPPGSTSADNNANAPAPPPDAAAAEPPADAAAAAPPPEPAPPPAAEPAEEVLPWATKPPANAASKQR